MALTQLPHASRTVDRHGHEYAFSSVSIYIPTRADLAVIMAANGGALVGSQLLRGDDSPLYPRGFKVCVGLVAIALATGVAQHVQYRLSNRRLARRAGLEEGLEGVTEEKGFRHTL